MTSLQQARLTAEDIKAARELVEKATPGPWSPEDDDTPDVIRGPHYEHLAIVSMVEDFGCIDADEYPEQYEETKATCLANAAFIAAARTLVPALLAEVERLTKERDEANESAASWGRTAGLAQTALAEALIAWEQRIDQSDYPDNEPARQERKRIAELWKTGGGQ